MAFLGYGTIAAAIAVLITVASLLRGKNPNNDRILAVESDQNKTPRHVSEFALRMVRPEDFVIVPEYPFADMAEKFMKGEHPHLYFVSPRTLSNPLTSGFENQRAVGHIAYLWEDNNHASRLASHTSLRDLSSGKKPRLSLSASSMGGTGSPQIVCVVEQSQRVRKDSGGNTECTLDVILETHCAGDFNEHTDRLLCNEAATSKELAVLISGGAALPNAGRNGWGNPEPFTNQISLTLTQNTGDKNMSLATHVAGMANAVYLSQSPGFAKYFHRDADDRKSKPNGSVPVCSAYGVATLFAPDYEYRTKRVYEIVQEVVVNSLNIVGDPVRVAVQHLRKHQMNEDGKSPGLADKVRRAAFEGHNPFRETLNSKPKKAFRVASRIKKVKELRGVIERKMAPLLKRFQAVVAEGKAAIEERCSVAFHDALRRMPLGTLVAVYRQIPSILTESQNRLEMTFQDRAAQVKEVDKKIGRVSEGARIHKDTRWRSRWKSIPSYQASPKVMLELLRQGKTLDTDAKTLDMVSALQEACRAVHAKVFLAFVISISDALTKAKKRAEDMLSSLRSHVFDHRGPGTCLKEFPEYDSEKDPRYESHVRTIEAEVRRLFIDKFEKNRQVPSSQEIIDLCLDRADKMIPQEASNAASLLMQRRDAAEVLEKTLREAAPALAVDPTGVIKDEITFVAIAEGEKSEAAPLIMEVASHQQITDIKFIPWPHNNEIVIFRAAFNIPLTAVKPIARAERALRSASFSQRLASYRAPIYFFLPFITQKPSRLDSMRFFLLAFVVGFVIERGGAWIFKSKTGREQDLGNLSIDRIEEVFQDYTNAAESASWFCTMTLSEGFQWAYNQIKAIGAHKDLAKDEWPKALNSLIEDFKAVAREHHEDLS